MTWIDAMRAKLEAMTAVPWLYAQVVDGIEARAIIDGRGYLFARVDDLENGKGIVALANSRDEILEVVEAAEQLRHYWRTACDCQLCVALIALRKKWEGT